MNIRRPLVPGFLKKIYQKLLLNKPGIWSSRIHLVLYYGVLFILFLALLAFLEPRDLRDYTTTKYWMAFVCIISVIALTVWLLYLLRFNVFKKYGNIRPLHALGTFVLYFICTGIIVLFPYVHAAVESMKANAAYGDEELVQDINDINIKVGQLAYHIFQTPWKCDTIFLVKDNNPPEHASSYYRQDYSVDDKGRKYVLYDQFDSTAFYNSLSGTDSLVKINETKYIEYKTPPFNFVYTAMVDDHTKTKLLTAFELYKKIYRHPPTLNEEVTIRKELDVLLGKYYYPHGYGYDNVFEHDLDVYFQSVQNEYRLTNVEMSIIEIVSKKYRWGNWQPWQYIRIFYYFTLGITLLIFIFRHSTVRAFFLTLLTGVLLAIITALIFSFANVEESTGFAWMAVYTILFFLGSLSAWKNQKRKVVTGIMINLFVLLIPFLPLLFVRWSYELKIPRFHEDPPIDYVAWDNYFLLAEIGGAVLLLILLATYIGKVYRRWYSLPED
jgi:hypothetical protein